MEKERNPVINKTDYIILISSLLLLLLGLVLMSLDSEPYGFGFLGLSAGPVVVMLGLLLPFFSIFPVNLKSLRNQKYPTYTKLNTLFGWLVFGAALTGYILTLEPTTSLWDSGEFISSAYKLQVTHPPGAPLFLLIGRLFSFLALGDVTRVAYFINMVSAVASALTVLFLFWSITLLARRILATGAKIPSAQTWLILSSGIVGSLSFAFTDSFWFSAVETEVYALSSFFTALVVWAMLQWRDTEDRQKGYRWLIFIAYLIGLSIGVHLLNLLALPALAFIYYQRYFAFRFKTALLTLAASLALIGLIMLGIIPGLPTLAGSFEVFFINTFGLPFGSGLLIFLVLFSGGLIYGLFWAHQTQRRWLQAAFLSFIYILIGYSSYLIVPIRSAYDPLIDENNPEDVLSFVSYLNREQYEQRPLFYGPQFTAELIDQKPGKAKYAKIKDRYEIIDHILEPVYDPKAMRLLPRLYSNQPAHLAEYKKWVNINENSTPSTSENLLFMLRYQLGHMYWRYFFWNFVGRQSDMEHAGVLWPWETEQNLPAFIKNNKAHNNYYLLPFLLGILGVFFHFRRNKQDGLVVLLLFIFTGVAIAFYLNQPPVEPRERDYAFTGSFYAFSIWIGLGVPALANWFRYILRNEWLRIAAASVLGLVVPGILLAQNWNDHNRSARFYARDSAQNILTSLAPNAILFTNGDNDTFPLWYAQEVEGIRRDVRVIVLTYLNTDWYISQMKRPAYESASLPISLMPENYQFSTNNYLPYVPKPQVKNGIDLQNFISLVKQNHPALQVMSHDGRSFLSLPTQQFSLSVNKEAILEMGIIPREREKDVVGTLTWAIKVEGLEKKHLVILDILATNNWQRPIYFSTTTNSADFMYLKPYLQLEGFAYRVLPVKNPDPESDAYIAKDLMYQNLMQKATWRNLDNPGIYYDETFRTQILPNVRQQFATLADAYLTAGNKEKAREVALYCLEKLPDASLPYDFTAPLFVSILTQTGETKKATELAATLKKRAVENLAYFTAQKKGTLFMREIQVSLMILQELLLAAQRESNTTEAAALEQLLVHYYNIYYR